ncbi:MAG: hypothetical protein NZL99_01235, partial [Burkholderiaceae bacterium]|nr:hypothetical protein [Burkholderiaceae bacterium]
ALFNDDLSAISPLAAGAGERDARLRGDAGLPQLRWVVALRRATQEQALQAAEALRPLLEAQRAAGALAGFESPADLLPSERTQRARQAALPAPPALRDALRQALAGSAFDPQAFEAFLQAVERTRTGPLLTPAYYADTLLAQRLRAQLLTDADGTTVLIMLHGLEAAAVATLRAALAAQGATLLDLKGDVERLIADYRRSALKAAAAGAALIIVLLALAVRQRQTVLRIVAALAAAVTITAAALVAAAGALTLFHWVALLLVAGVGCNYALFFAQLPHDPAARARVLYSALLAAATTFMAFALLAASGTPVLHMIGVTVAIGVLVALACSAALAAVERSPH